MNIKIISACFLIFLGACTSIPHMKGDARVTSISLTKVEEQVKDSAIFTQGDFPTLEWWKAFDDNQLCCVIEEALRDNPTLKKAEARLAYATELAKVKRSYLVPTVGFEAQTNWMYYGQNSFFRSIDSTIPPYIHQIDVGSTLSYEFDFWGKNKHLFKAALGFKRAEMAEMASSKLMITAAVAKIYFTIQKDLARQHLLKELEHLKKSLVELTKETQIHGLTAQMKNLSAQDHQEKIQEALLENQKMTDTDHYILDSLTGQSPGSYTMKYVSLDTESHFTLPSTIALDLVARRPDLTAQIWRVESIAHEVGAAKADFYPNIDLNIFAGLESIHFGNLFSAKSYLYSILPAIHLPIFNAGRLKANLKSKQAKFEEAIFSYNETLLKAAQEVADGIAAVRWISKQIDSQIKVLQLADEQVRLATLRLKQGLGTAFDVIDQKEYLLSEQLKMIDLKHLLALSKISLIKALGGGFNG